MNDVISLVETRKIQAKTLYQPLTMFNGIFEHHNYLVNNSFIDTITDLNEKINENDIDTVSM